MANSTASDAATQASVQPVGGTALRGRIEAIGVFDLLRIPVAQGSTGRLLVFNDQFDAELYYVEGRLAAAVSSSGNSAESLNLALQMTDGEFEFATGLELPVERHDETLQDALTQAIRNHYHERVRARQDSVNDQTQFVRTSGVHRVTVDPSVTVSPVVSIEQPMPNAVSAVPSLPTSPTAVAGAARLLPGELGRATTDSAGRASAKIGQVSPQEAALAALASKLAHSLAATLGMRDLQRFEIIGSNQRALLCSVTSDGIRLSSVATNQVDIDDVWRELEP